MNHAGLATTLRVAVILSLLATLPSPVRAQGDPTGAIGGHVIDPDALPLPGVAVTVASDTIQIRRMGRTSASGDFLIPFLPAGEYTVRFDLADYRTQSYRIEVTMADIHPMQVAMAIADQAESVTVVASDSTDIPRTFTIAETYKAADIGRSPVGRTLTDAVLLAPGSANTGPIQSDGSRAIVISGALSYDSLFLINGVDVNENLRGQPHELYVEDAIQETKISTGGISAEYGRFQGGVVNMITKSGGDTFSGSFRMSLANDRWQARTPYPGDQKIANVTPTYEVTFGGPIKKERIWFFGSGRLENRRQDQALSFTGIHYTAGSDDRRGEAKVTYALNPANSLKASYTKRAEITTNNHFGTVMDQASLYDGRTRYGLSVINYTRVVSNNLFLEGQLSSKTMTTTDTGARFTDLVRGTPIWDRSRGQARFNSPTFCAVCGGGWLENRDNWDWFTKVSYFLSTSRSGSHTLTLGFDNFKETRRNDNWQSGSSYRIQATSSVIDGTNTYPVFNSDNSTYIEYLPLVAESVGNDIRTYSGFANDAWRFNGRMSFNLGYRYDRNRSTDQTGLPAVGDSAFSPRLGLTWDARGDGRWTLRTGFARYVAATNAVLVDAGSAGGRTASYSYFYKGPPINTGTGPYLDAAQALPLLFNWFFANGGLSQPTRNAPKIPGLTTRVGGDARAPHANDYSAGISREFTAKAAVRVDYVYRTYHDMYGEFLSPLTGRVTDPTGERYDLTVVRNAQDAGRTYQGVVTNATYRVPRLQIGANYTLSWSRGNVDGESSTSGPTRTDMNSYTEYKQPVWNSLFGYSATDQRHKVRGWLTYSVPAADRIGTVYAGLIQRFDSGLPYDASGDIDSRPYVSNPGYLTPPSTVVYYFSGRNAFRFDPSWSTDLSIEWTRRLGRGRSAAFLRAVTTNLFNGSTVLSGDSTIVTAASPGSVRGLQPFNPFVAIPVRGVNWAYGPTFGEPTGPDSYQVPRTFSCSFGIRY